jgi:chemotaxis signal transduction protein
LRFHRTATEFDERTCVIIVNLDGMVIGLIVDRVDEVVTMTPDHWNLLILSVDLATDLFSQSVSSEKRVTR